MKTLLINALLLNENYQTIQSFIHVENGYIIATGAMSELVLDLEKVDVIDCHGQLVTPAFIDCHTHLVYGGNRAHEFALRLKGVPYEAIAKAGGGIRSTVRDTRELSLEDLFQQSLPRMLSLRDEGVGSVEIKSGYGLDIKNELKMLEVGHRLGLHTGQQVLLTFLGAHTLPPEFDGKQQTYVDYVCQEMIPAVAEQGYATAVDVFCEHIAFSVKQTEQIFETAKQYQLQIKCHAEQLSNTDVVRLAAQYQALSCDHLEHISKEGVQDMAKHGVIAVLLPGAYYFLRETKKPPVQWFREFGVNMAIATDCNPGTSPTTSIRLMMNMACILFGLTPQESYQAVTQNAAKALGIAAICGDISTGKRADLILWETKNPDELSYGFINPLTHRLMLKGDWINKY